MSKQVSELQITPANGSSACEGAFAPTSAIENPLSFLNFEGPAQTVVQPADNSALPGIEDLEISGGATTSRAC